MSSRRGTWIGTLIIGCAVLAGSFTANGISRIALSVGSVALIVLSICVAIQNHSH